jgi:CubicO group peptidase (beta-lactamase class C family)
MKTTSISRRTFLAGSALFSAAALVPGFGQRKRGPASAPASDWKAQVDSIVADMMKQDGVPGVMVGVVKNGQVAYKKGYGVKRLSTAGAPDENTVFYIGSLSKAVTAVGAMLLVQEGKLDLDVPASQYIKDLPKKWHAITVKEFMTHTSGIPEISKREKNAQKNIREVYAIMENMPMAFKPGTKEEYNNFNYAVTGNLIEVRSNMSYIDYMRAKVFKPLGMDHSGIGKISPGNHATGYDRDKNGKLTETEPDVIGFGIPSGGLETNLDDLLKLEASLRTNTLLKPRFFKMMITPFNGFNATPGWFTREPGGITVVSKNGAAGGFSSFLAFAPEREAAIIMLRNVKGKDIAIQGPSNAILDVCCGVPKHGKASD